MIHIHIKNLLQVFSQKKFHQNQVKKVQMSRNNRIKILKAFRKIRPFLSYYLFRNKYYKILLTLQISKEQSDIQLRLFRPLNFFCSVGHYQSRSLKLN